MAEATGTTRPARKRATPAKKAATTTPAAKAEGPGVATDGDITKLTFELEYEGDTKSYAKFKVPTGNGSVGSIYAPLGTTQVKVLIVGPAE